MVYENIAQGGATITAEVYSSDGTTPKHWICRTIANMADDADFAIIEGGVNDASKGVEIGAITDGFTATLDDTTYCGAFESMLKQLITRFAGKKVGYIAVHKMTDNYAGKDGDYCYLAQKCCEKWGVPFLNLNAMVPPLNYIPDLKSQYTSNGDGWHPNEAGYKKYYCDKIETWLTSL
jgi:lysophospholipase L1-like esterase